MMKLSKMKPEVEFLYGGRLFFQSGVYLSCVLRYVDEIWLADAFWPSEGSDINKCETENNIERPWPPS